MKGRMNMNMNFSETRQKELKREYTDSILKTVSAFANYDEIGRASCRERV